MLAQNPTSKADAGFATTQQTSPTHRRLPVQLLSRETKVRLVALEAQVETETGGNDIHPRGHDVVIAVGAFRLRDPSGHLASAKPAADQLFTSPAENITGRTHGVVLSRTGSGDSDGLRASRESGGFMTAQQPDACKYHPMPEAVIRSACADLMLPPPEDRRTFRAAWWCIRGAPPSRTLPTSMSTSSAFATS